MKATEVGPAVFSECRRYRYTLTREWGDGGRCVFIGLNPSTADERTLDPTLRRCVRYAMDWGYGRMTMLNLFAFRATDPRDMKAADDPVGPLNNDFLLTYCADAEMVVAAWGVHGNYRDRDMEVARMLVTSKIDVHCLAVAKNGAPRHPLYLAKTLKPATWLAEIRP